MMPTSVKMSEADKARLERLQARLTQRTGRRVSQQDLLARLVRLGEAQPDLLAPERRWRLSKAQRERLFSLPVDTRGPPTREEDIDRDLYGERPA